MDKTKWRWPAVGMAATVVVLVAVASLGVPDGCGGGDDEEWAYLASSTTEQECSGCVYNCNYDVEYCVSEAQAAADKQAKREDLEVELEVLESEVTKQEKVLEGEKFVRDEIKKRADRAAADSQALAGADDGDEFCEIPTTVAELLDVDEDVQRVALWTTAWALRVRQTVPSDVNKDAKKAKSKKGASKPGTKGKKGNKCKKANQATTKSAKATRYNKTAARAGLLLAVAVEAGKMIQRAINGHACVITITANASTRGAYADIALNWQNALDRANRRVADAQKKLDDLKKQRDAKKKEVADAKVAEAAADKALADCLAKAPWDEEEDTENCVDSGTCTKP